MGRPFHLVKVAALGLSVFALFAAPRVAPAANEANNAPPPKKQMSQKELARLRMAEIQSGARGEANR